MRVVSPGGQEKKPKLETAPSRAAGRRPSPGCRREKQRANEKERVPAPLPASGLRLELTLAECAGKPAAEEVRVCPVPAPASQSRAWTGGLGAAAEAQV